jgi:hypothetical protein
MLDPLASEAGHASSVLGSVFHREAGTLIYPVIRTSLGLNRTLALETYSGKSP